MESGMQTENRTAAEADPEVEVSRTVVTDLLARMKIPSETNAHWVEPEDTRESRHVLVDVTGPDLGIMISRRAEALTALQQIARLIIARKLGDLVPVVVEMDGYRLKREQQLRRMARRAAEQAMERGRTVVLEPMPANERRIIHLELRDHTAVATESVGIGRQRKVTVVLKSRPESPAG
jgi:spoIIIJ-associated protein